MKKKIYKYKHTNGEIITKSAVVVETNTTPEEYFNSPFVEKWWVEFVEENKEKIKTVLETIIEDCKKDVEAFEGKPFKGSVVAEYFGIIEAKIQALAKIIKELHGLHS